MLNLAPMLNPEGLRLHAGLTRAEAPKAKTPFSAEVVWLDGREKKRVFPEVVSGCCCCEGPVPSGP